jgi:ABC-type branched-subunit amino acid transport system ATPase component
MTLLTVEGLTVRYGAALAVDNISLEVGRHEIVGVLGPNGAGKSSLLKAIAGLVRPAGGRVLLDGEDVTRHGAERRARKGLVLVPEGRKTFGPLTVEENLRVGAYPSGNLGKAELDRRLGKAFELFPVLKERRKQVAGTLSGGESAMLAIARGLMSRPRTILLDEPSLGLAPTVTARLFEQLAQLKEIDIGAVVVEQKAAQLLDIVDRSLVMRQGRQEHWSEEAISLDELDRMYLGANWKTSEGSQAHVAGPGSGKE